MLASRAQLLLASGWLLAFCSGCAHSPYRFGVGESSSRTPYSATCTHHTVSVGGDHPRIDQLETVVQSIPSFVRKLVLQNQGIERYLAEGRLQSVELCQYYLESNNLDDVYIDVRRYEPRQQWQRLWENDRIGLFWKATGGTLSVVRYSILPQRAFHIDDYNPFTNTLSINSGRPANALYDAANVKQFRRPRWQGTYATAQYAPLVPLWHHTQVSRDVLSFAETQQLWDLQRKLYPITYGNMADTAAKQVFFFFPIASQGEFAVPVIRVALRGVGRLTGRAVADHVSNRRDSTSDR